jgi:hypothetical protein
MRIVEYPMTILFFVPKGQQRLAGGEAQRTPVYEQVSVKSEAVFCGFFQPSIRSRRYERFR